MRIRAVSTVTPRFPNTVIEMPNFATDSAAALAPPELTFRDSIAAAAYEEAGIGPDELSLAEVYDLSTALELDWYENIGLCKPGEAEKLLNDGDTTIGGRVPVNPSGGLACFGEAVPAQAIAQICEVTWQLRGQADGPPGRGRHRRPHRQPGPLRPRQRGPAHDLTTFCGRSTLAMRAQTSTERRLARDLAAMAVQLNHTIVHARDAEASAAFLSEMLGLGAPRPLRARSSSWRSTTACRSTS